MKNDERQAQLAKTWKLLADAVVRTLEAENPSASALAVALRFLEANGVTLSVLQSWRDNGLGGLVLPKFSDDDDSEQNSGGATDNAALATVPPFAPADED
jgi:hypothetical protein